MNKALICFSIGIIIAVIAMSIGSKVPLNPYDLEHGVLRLYEGQLQRFDPNAGWVCANRKVRNIITGCYSTDITTISVNPDPNDIVYVNVSEPPTSNNHGMAAYYDHAIEFTINKKSLYLDYDPNENLITCSLNPTDAIKLMYEVLVGCSSMYRRIQEPNDYNSVSVRFPESQE